MYTNLSYMYINTDSSYTFTNSSYMYVKYGAHLFTSEAGCAVFAERRCCPPLLLLQRQHPHFVHSFFLSKQRS